MIHNTICPYCGISMNKCHNDDMQRTKEHLIPKVMYRTNKEIEPDFYACKKCNNEKKGTLDYIISWLSKVTSMDDQLALEAAKKALIDPNHNNVRATSLITNATWHDNGLVSIPMPVSGKEIIRYATMLTQGQHFIDNGLALLPSEYIIKTDYVPPIVWHKIKSQYMSTHGSDCIDDLQKNPHSSTTRENECVVYRKNGQYLFVFHQYFALSGEIFRLSRNNKKQVRTHHRKILAQLANKKRLHI